MDVKKNVRRILEARSMTVENFASTLGVSTMQAYRYFRNPTVSSLEKMARALGVPVASLLSDEKTEVEPNGSFVCPCCGSQIFFILKGQ